MVFRGRHVGDRRPAGHVPFAPVLGHRDVVGQGPPADQLHAHVDDQMLAHTHGRGHPTGGRQIDGVALPVAEAQAVGLISLSYAPVNADIEKQAAVFLDPAAFFGSLPAFLQVRKFVQMLNRMIETIEINELENLFRSNPQ
jgi:hypothetical protein